MSVAGLYAEQVWQASLEDVETKFAIGPFFDLLKLMPYWEKGIAAHVTVWS